MTAAMLDNDVRDLLKTWRGEGSGIGSAHSQVYRLLSVHTDDARAYATARLLYVMKEEERQDFIDGLAMRINTGRG